MREYLFEFNGKYSLVKRSAEYADGLPQYIEIPEGAIEARLNGSGRINFIDSESNYMNAATSGQWIDTHKHRHDVHELVWSRLAVDNVNQQPTIQDTLKQRASTYGSFEDVARTTEVIMEELGRVRVNGLSELPYPHRMALYMIASKMSRIVNGDFNHKDSWHDIGGYAKLVEDLIDD